MALILCPECQQKVSDKASQCPHCGFRLSPAAENAPAQAASAGEPARPQTLPVPSDDDRSGSVTAAAPEQKTKNTESSPKTPMENKKKLMIGAAVAAVLLIGYFVFFSGGNAQTPAPSLPSARPTGDQTPGTQGGTGYTPFGTTTPLDANYSLFTSNRFGFTCYVPINDYVTEDEEYNIYVSSDAQAYIPYTMVSRYDYTDAPGVLEAVMNNLQ